MVHSCDIAWNTTKVHAALTEVHFTPGSKPSLFSPQWGPFFHNSTRSLFKKCRNGKTEFARVYLFFAALLSSAAAAKPLAPRRGPDSSADGPLFVWLCHVKLKTETRWRKRWEKSLNPIEGPTCSVSKQPWTVFRLERAVQQLDSALGGSTWRQHLNFWNTRRYEAKLCILWTCGQLADEFTKRSWRVSRRG